MVILDREKKKKKKRESSLAIKNGERNVQKANDQITKVCGMYKLVLLDHLRVMQQYLRGLLNKPHWFGPIEKQSLDVN